MRQRQQPDHDPTGLTRRLRGDQRLPSAAECGPREQLIAIDQVEQRHRLAPESVDDVAVVDDVGGAAMPGAARSPAARQRQHQRAAEQAFQPIVVEPHPQAVTDQPGRNGIKDMPEQKPAAAGDGDQFLLVVVGSPTRQFLELCTLDLERLASGGVGAPDQFIDEAQ